jgi:hypothetical protein
MAAKVEVAIFCCEGECGKNKQKTGKMENVITFAIFATMVKAEIMVIFAICRHFENDKLMLQYCQ